MKRQKKKPKGSVTIENFRGRLRLRLPRQVFGGEQRYLSLGLSADSLFHKKIAKAKAQEIEADIVLEKFDLTLMKYKKESPSKLTLDELWQRFTDFKKKFLAETTINHDFKKIKNYINKLPSKQISDAKIIRNYLIDNFSPDTAKRTLKWIKACCRWAVEEELISSNPFANLSIPRSYKEKKQIDPFTKSERDLIVSSFERHPRFGHYASFVKFLFLTGCRPSEAIALQWQHVDPAFTKITFSEAVVDKVRKDTKTHTIRKFPVNSQLRSLLLQIRPSAISPETPLFVSPKGSLIDQHNFGNRAWMGVVKELPIPYRSQYNTRHTFITHCLEAKIPVTQVAAWVGNSPEIIYQHYAGVVNIVDVPEI